MDYTGVLGSCTAASQCSSVRDCESGWTLYLDDHQWALISSSRNDIIIDNNNRFQFVNTSTEEEDLSMVSDASSGPPVLRSGNNNIVADHHHHHHEGCFCHLLDDEDDDATFPTAEKIEKKKDGRSGELPERCSSFLDDTAASSSPVVSFPAQNNLTVNKTQECSSTENISATCVQGGRSALREPLDFFQSCSPQLNHQMVWKAMGMRDSDF